VEKRHCDRNEGPLAWSEDGGEIEAAPAAMDANATLLEQLDSRNARDRWKGEAA
jgi:hypothetical protein